MSLNQNLTCHSEIKDLLSWLGNPAKSPKQCNKINESDCEIIKINPNLFLAATIDSVADEISIGLYQDPYLIGWVTAQSSLSDLAAVGCEVIGLLLSTQWKEETSSYFKKKFAEGFHDALHLAKTFLLGGDTGVTSSSVFSSVGLGVINKQPISRVGIHPGDFICITGKSGIGPALSFRFLNRENESEFPEEYFRPTAKLKEGQYLSQIASAMIDTSDGIINSINHLYTLNHVGFELIWNPETLDSKAVKYCEKRNLPLWLLWLGEHGDFQLIFTISPNKMQEAKYNLPDLKIIGRTTPNKNNVSINFLSNHKSTEIELDLNEFQISQKYLNRNEIKDYFHFIAENLRKKNFL